MADVKELAVRASLDVGDNITKLVRQLAAQIGTTTDKVFPWYVKQQVIEGWCWIGCSVFGMVVGFCISLAGLKIWDHGPKADNELSGAAIAIGIVIFATALLFLIFGMTGSLTQINNPEYYAIKSMTGDMARLVGK